MTQQPAINIQASDQFWNWLNTSGISLAFTTYQTNRLFLVGCNQEGRLAVNERVFDRPMGLYGYRNSLYMATRYQLWQLENRLMPGENHHGNDRLYVPSQSYTTGDLNTHDVVVDQHQRLLFINTTFSCLATLQSGFSFKPLWRPPFISKLVAEDRCHLNGLAMRGGQPTYVTACSSTNHAAGWRDHRQNGGIVMHIPDNDIIATGLSMPHSPRWYRGKLWLLNSGSGEFGYIDDERFRPVTFCPGFVRGLAFWENYALVGLSKLRSKVFGDLALETALQTLKQPSQCGLRVIDLNTGAIVHSLQIEGIVEELFDVVVLPGVRKPKALGFQNDDIQNLVSFPESGGIITTKPAVQRRDAIAQITEPTSHDPLATADKQPIKYQRVYHLTPENLAPYDEMTYPSLQKHWQTRELRGELHAVSASVDGTMVGFAVAEQLQEAGPNQNTMELLSLYVLPAYRRQGIGATLVKYLQKA